MIHKKKGIFITATGTDVGKTYVTALILKKLREASVNAGYYKAALSGAYRKDRKSTRLNSSHPSSSRMPSSA